MPMFAQLKMKDLRTYHIQQFVQYLATEKKRLDGREGGIAASTVKQYTTVLRSIVTTAYKAVYFYLLEFFDLDFYSRISFASFASHSSSVNTPREFSLHFYRYMSKMAKEDT